VRVRVCAHRLPLIPLFNHFSIHEAGRNQQQWDHILSTASLSPLRFVLGSERDSTQVDNASEQEEASDEGDKKKGGGGKKRGAAAQPSSRAAITKSSGKATADFAFAGTQLSGLPPSPRHKLTPFVCFSVLFCSVLFCSVCLVLLCSTLFRFVCIIYLSLRHCLSSVCCVVLYDVVAVGPTSPLASVLLYAIFFRPVPFLVALFGFVCFLFAFAFSFLWLVLTRRQRCVCRLGFQ
jgi:hypothetical protein